MIVFQVRPQHYEFSRLFCLFVQDLSSLPMISRVEKIAYLKSVGMFENASSDILDKLAEEVDKIEERENEV